MKTQLAEDGQRSQGSFLDESTIELFRRYLQEAVLRDSFRAPLRLGWIDN